VDYDLTFNDEFEYSDELDIDEDWWQWREDTRNILNDDDNEIIRREDTKKILRSDL
jgi:hypothetical protein